MKDKLIKKLRNKEAVLAVVGLGYVGLPLALACARSNYRVVGFDIDPQKVELINEGKSYIKYIEDAAVAEPVNAKLLEATSAYGEVARADAVILCLPTPLDKQRRPDLSFVLNTVEGLLPYLKKGQLLSLESTTYPGTTEEELLPRLSSQGLLIGEDFFLVYSPEREDPGNKEYFVGNIPKVVGGATGNCLEVGKELYEGLSQQVVAVSSSRTAELTKLLENIYRAVNIGLVNEMKMVADKMGIDIWEVIDAASTKPFGFTPFYPGPGWGGHCIPIDPFYLTWKAREYGVDTKFIELSGEVNTEMPRWVLYKIMEGLNEREKALKNSQILVLGLSYKKNVADVRESPAVKLMELLREKKADIYYSDPYFPRFPEMREHSFDLVSMEINAENLAQMDCVVICTDHDEFDYDFILENSDLIIDTRGVFRINSPQIVKA